MNLYLIPSSFTATYYYYTRIRAEMKLTVIATLSFHVLVVYQYDAKLIIMSTKDGGDLTKDFDQNGTGSAGGTNDEERQGNDNVEADNEMGKNGEIKEEANTDKENDRVTNHEVTNENYITTNLEESSKLIIIQYLRLRFELS